MVTAPEGLEGWSYQHVPGEGVPPDDRAWEEGVAVHLDASWDDLIFVWVVISCTVREHWGKVVIATDGSLLGMDPIHQEEARDLSSFLECVLVKVVDHSGVSGQTLPLTIVVRDKSGHTSLGVFNFSYLLPGVWVPYGATIF